MKEKQEKLPYWRVLQKEHLYFVNKNIVKTGIENDNTDFTKKNKAIWIMLPGGILFVTCVGLMMFAHSIILEIPAILASIWIYQWILRKKVFDENLYKRMNANNQMNQEVSMNGPFNNLLKIDNGQWFYQDTDKGLQTAVLVTFDYNSILDLSLNANENVIQNAYIPFIKRLHDMNCSFDFYDIDIKNDISYGVLQEIKKTKILEKGSWLQLISAIQNDTLSELEQKSGYDHKKYFLIFNNDFRNVTNFVDVINSVIEEELLSNSTIVNPRICQEDEIVLFIKNYFQIKSFNPDSIVRNVEHLDISRYFNFVYFVDQNGARYPLSDLINISGESGPLLTPEFVNAKENDYDKALAKEKARKEHQREVLERERLAKVLKQEKSSMNGLQKGPRKVTVPGLIQNKLARQKASQKVKLNEAKAKENQKILEQKKHNEELIKQRKTGLNFNDNTSLDDLLMMSKEMNKHKGANDK